MKQFVAFFRGINVGGNKKVQMTKVKEVFSRLGFTDVGTLLNTGNVVFSSDKTDLTELTRKIEQGMQKNFGFEVPTLIRTMDDILSLIRLNPFHDVTVTPETRLYVTFLSDSPDSKLSIPFETPEKDFSILSVHNKIVCSVLELNKKRRTTESMNILEKEFGKKVTTRNWNTIVKISKLAVFS